MSPFVLNYLSAFRKGAELKVAAKIRLHDRPKPEGMKAEDVVPMNGPGRTYADYMLPGSMGGYRAGKSESLARSIGKDPGFTVTHPLTSTLLAALPMGFAGKFLGGSIGEEFGGPLGMRLPSGRMHIGGQTIVVDGGNVGSALGGVTGGLIGALMVGARRRSNMLETNHAFNESPTISPVIRTGNPLSIASGSHDRGRSVAVDQMTGGMGETPLSPKIQSGVDVLGQGMSYGLQGSQILGMLDPVQVSNAINVGTLAALPVSLGTNITNKMKASRTEKEIVAREQGQQL